ncbi:hypothetical protein LCGC14_0723150 [marine sediment metagenome]|uniref:Uncharacterized protein n=1 Tax=marine sediment metagenome TaxID=412755 RepID=A0A0F9QFZ1_9ZZZZ
MTNAQFDMLEKQYGREEALYVKRSLEAMDRSMKLQEQYTMNMLGSPLPGIVWPIVLLVLALIGASLWR